MKAILHFCVYDKSAMSESASMEANEDETDKFMEGHNKDAFAAAIDDEHINVHVSL